VDEELRRLIIHGILHLSGMDHSDNSPDQPMLELQERLLRQMGGDAIL
jgi:probable rRNA maturation factor